MAISGNVTLSNNSFTLKHLTEQIGNYNLYDFKENGMLHNIIKSNLKITHVIEIINATLVYYYTYLKKGIETFGKNIQKLLNEERNCVLDKHDIFEFDETMDLNLINKETNMVNKKYASAFFHVEVLPLYLDMCEFWLYTGNHRGITLLKIFKEQMIFPYLSKTYLSKYYFLIGTYFHLAQNIKQAAKYYHRSVQIYKNLPNVYYFTLCCIHLKRYDEAKKCLTVLYDQCKNAYVLKLYSYFYVHTANVFLNYNVVKQVMIGKSEEEKPQNRKHKKVLNDGGSAQSEESEESEGDNASKGDEGIQNNADIKEILTEQTGSIIDDKFTKSDNKGEIEIVQTQLQEIMKILQSNEAVFTNDIDVQLMKVKIYELLLTKTNEVSIQNYLHSIKKLNEWVHFYQTTQKRQINTYIPYELVNNYIVAMAYCDSKEHSLELLQFLRAEIFSKLKMFTACYNILEIEEQIPLYKEQMSECLQNANNTELKKYIPLKEKEGTKKRKHRDTVDDVHVFSKNVDDVYTGEYQKKKNFVDCSNKKIKPVKYRENHFDNHISGCHDNDTNVSNVDEKEKDYEEAKNMLMKNVVGLMKLFRKPRIYNIKKEFIEKGEIQNMVLRNAKRNKYKNIINYLKRIYVVVSFNTFVVLEMLGYREQAIRNYKAFVKIYVNYEDAFIRLAQIYIKDNKLERAKAVIDKGLKHNPFSVKLYLLKSRLHLEGRYYKYSRYLIHRVRNNKYLENNYLLNTYKLITDYICLRGREDNEKTDHDHLINKMFNEIDAFFKLKKNNFYIENLLCVMLSENSKYELALEAFHLLLDSHDKYSFYYNIVLRNMITHMMNQLMENKELLENKLFVNKLNVCFHIYLKHGTANVHFYLMYCNYLHKTEQYDAAIDVLCNCYVKWPHDFEILNFLIICIDASVSKCLNSDYVRLNEIVRVKNLIELAFRAIFSLLYWKRFTTTAKLVGADESYSYYHDDTYLVSIKSSKVENLASRNYLIATYRKLEEKIKPYIESSLPVMLQNEKKNQMKRIMIQQKMMTREKKRKSATKEV